MRGLGTTWALPVVVAAIWVPSVVGVPIPPNTPVSEASPDVVATRIGDREAEVAQINERLAAVEQKLATSHSCDINREHPAQTLSQFAELWDVLYPRERVELVRSLIERVTYHDATDDIQVQFGSRG